MQTIVQTLAIHRRGESVKLVRQGIKFTGEESAQGSDDRCIAAGIIRGEGIIEHIAGARPIRCRRQMASK